MTLWHYKGICNTCNSGIGWTKQSGWQHISNTQCTMLIPKEGTVNR